MTKCDFAGAGVMLFFWVVAFVVDIEFEKQLGQVADFLLLIMGIVGIWAGKAARDDCKAKRQ